MATRYRHSCAEAICESSPIQEAAIARGDLLSVEMLVEKTDHVSVKLLVEDSAVKAGRVGADSGSIVRQLRRADGEEGEVFGILHEMPFGFRWQPVSDRSRTAPRETVGLERGVRTPQLNRNGHGREPICLKEEFGPRIDDNRGLDTWIVRGRLSGKRAVLE